MKPDKLRNITFGLIILSAVVCRLYQLGADALWIDEIRTVAWSHYDLTRMLIGFLERHIESPLYFFILHFWIVLTGLEPFVIRLLSAVFGVLSLTQVYRLAGRVVDQRSALMTVFLLSISVFHLSYSQTIRPYTLLLWLSVWSMNVFLDWSGSLGKELERSHLRNRYAAVTILAVFSHVIGFFVIVLQNIYCYFARRKLSKEFKKDWILMQSAFALPLIVWGGILLSRFRHEKDFWITLPSFDEIVLSFVDVAGSWPLFILLFGLFCFGFIRAWRERGQPRGDLAPERFWLLVIWLVTPAVLIIVMSLLIWPLYQARYLVIALVPFYLFIGYGITNISTPPVRKALFICVIAGTLMAFRVYFSTPDKGRAWVFENIEKEERLGSAAIILGREYYSRKMYDRAFELFDYSRKLSLKNDEAGVNGLGVVFAELGLHRLAKLEFNRMIKTGYRSIDGLLNLGEIALRENNINEARHYFEESLKIKETDLGHIGLGSAALLENDLDTAAGHYEKALELNSWSLGALINLGNLYYMVGDFSTALRYYFAAIEVDAGYVLGYENLARTYLAMGQREMAEYYMYKVKQLVNK